MKITTVLKSESVRSQECYNYLIDIFPAIPGHVTPIFIMRTGNVVKL